MELQNQLTLNQKRYFGDVIGDGITFMKINFKPIGLAFVTYVIPCLLIPVVGLGFFGGLDKFINFFSLGGAETVMNGGAELILPILGSVFFFIIAYFVLYLIIYSAFLAYEDNGQIPITYEELTLKMKESWGTYLTSVLFLFLIVFLIGIIVSFIMFIFVGMISGGSGGGVVAKMLIFTLFMFFFFSFICYFMTILSNFVFINMREKQGVSASWSRSFALIKKNWWATFGILIVSSLISGIASYAFSVPFHLITGFGALSGVGGLSGSLMMAAVAFLIYQLGSMFLGQYVSACTVLKYYDLVEQKDGSSIATQIDMLGESPDSFFENEGEY